MTIVRRPDGEAPEWVRDAWIGLKLPVLNEQKRRLAIIHITEQPLTVAQHLWRMLFGKHEYWTGYVVSGEIAVERLGETRPDAAEWWRSNAPQHVQRNSCLVFDQQCGEFRDDLA